MKTILILLTVFLISCEDSFEPGVNEPETNKSDSCIVSYELKGYDNYPAYFLLYVLNDSISSFEYFEKNITYYNHNYIPDKLPTDKYFMLNSYNETGPGDFNISGRVMFDTDVDNLHIVLEYSKELF